MSRNDNPFASRRNALGLSKKPSGFQLCIDAFTVETEYIVEIDLPGCSASDVVLTLENGELTIDVRRERPANTVGTLTHAFRERKFGIFSRTIALPGATMLLASTMVNGVLTATVQRRGASSLDVETS
jgi:HSP20 family molecular chaperone IbpA